MRRLTKRQYQNTLTDVIAKLLGKDAAEAVVREVGAALSLLPEEERKKVPQDLHGSYRRLDQDLQQAHAEAYVGVAAAVGAALAKPARLSTLLGACAGDANKSNDASCVSNFARRLGELAFRRPVSGDEADMLLRAYAAEGIDAAGIADVVTLALAAPQFLYLIESGEGKTGDQGVAELTPYELANRLSYHFWDTMPDEELLEQAASGRLKDEDVLREQVERLYDDERTQQTVTAFFKEWLKLEDVAVLDQAKLDAAGKAFVGAQVPSPRLRDHVQADALDLVRHYVNSDSGTLDDILTTDLSFARAEELASIYGVPPWMGSGDPPRFADGQRPGILTRAALLSNGSPQSRPVMRGVFIRKTILCDDLPTPPANAAAMTDEDDGSAKTTRQRIASLTESEGSSCRGCHATVINPLGFAFEGFDALGRFRSEQKIFSSSGQMIAALPVDTTSVPGVIEGDETESSGPADAVRLIVESGKPPACLARNYFRFTFGRWEDPERDGCILEGLRKAALGSGSLQQMLKEVALAKSFVSRSFD